MGSDGHDDRPWILDDCQSNPLWTHCSGLSEGHGQGVNSTGVPSIAYPGASVPGPPFHTQSYPITYDGRSSFHFHQHGSTHAVPPQVPFCDYTSPVSATVSDNDSEGHQDTGAYSANTPAEQWDAQVSWRYTSWLTRSLKLFLVPHLYDTGGPTTDVFRCELYGTPMCRILAAEK